MDIDNFSQFIIFAAFISLTAGTFINKISRNKLRLKKIEDWLIDGISLTIQGIFIPLLQATLVYSLYHHLFPQYQGYLKLSPILSFILSFLIIDYIYYWNHRLLHSQKFWNIHQVHHTITDMDVLGTSRNTIWTSLFIIYLWIHPLFIYFLSDPTAYLLGISLTSALDLWRHSGLLIATNSWFCQLLSPWLILPQDHDWHHSRENHHYNYGANFKLWDKIHRTYYQNKELPKTLGIDTSLNLFQKLFFPFV
ncbi:sterol desaturase family protein [Okeanomitos corallinicola TIOX110]|uniref:Sterol desaturase family protein n=1 Tax=Okeanomitos corallinicola TIOX110 TaxID=3133117 RepID=A0ABZ2UTD5_9CYAN